MQGVLCQVNDIGFTGVSIYLPGKDGVYRPFEILVHSLINDNCGWTTITLVNEQKHEELTGSIIEYNDMCIQAQWLTEDGELTNLLDVTIHDTTPKHNFR